MSDIDTSDCRLATAIAPQLAEHAGQSGIYLLPDASEAFAARALLAKLAERTLDVQYYIWRYDMTGTIMFDALRAAAKRGVRVRILLDDNNTAGLDETLTALDAHPNIEVRLFNPLTIRTPRWLGYVTDLLRLNRRMHNKSFTSDNQATIIGGRNIGDEYFDASEDMVFADLDVIAVGPVANDVSADFERYWRSKSARSVTGLLPRVKAARYAELAKQAPLIDRDAKAAAYVGAIHNLSFVRQLVEGNLALEWAPTRMISDVPAKVRGRVKRRQLMFEKLTEIIGESVSHFDLVSPYFVPTAAGVDAFVALAKRGVKIRVLTNSLEATDVIAVHAGYAKRRKPLLKAGIKLYELRRMSSDPRPRKRVIGSRGSDGSSGSSSSSSLHAKTFSVDRSRVFIGSFNFDPRSAQLNTELGFIIDSPTLAQRIESAISERLAATTYEVRLSESGKLYWVEDREGQLVTHNIEPGTSPYLRAVVCLLSVLPIDWLL